MPPIYDPEAVQPMRDELINVGIESLESAEQVDEILSRGGTALIVINSVCGCAAGGARPGVTKALQHNRIPDHLGTVFAGMEQEAVAQARAKMVGIPPSSPCIALFQDGSPVFVMERSHIEQMDADMIAQALKETFDQYCSRQGPSISPEEYAKLESFKACGSSIPLFGG
ncbi:MAG: BrxA/BrxB family bacilliredoxin [bacterium]|jgi:putative YphP/YqiW family bacilliredoxin